MQFTRDLTHISNGYAHSYCGSMDFMEAQLAFLGYWYGVDTKKVMFMLCGDWFENEMAKQIQSSSQKLTYSNLPVYSGIVETLPTVDTEEKLVEVIDALNAGSDMPSYASEEDIARVNESMRKIKSLSTTHVMALPKTGNASHLKAAKEFLTFVGSDAASEIMSKTTNGSVMSAYRGEYNVLEDETLNLSDLGRDVSAVRRNAIAVPGYNSQPLLYLGGFDSWCGVSFYADCFNGTRTADEILNAMYNNVRGGWQQTLRDSGLIS